MDAFERSVELDPNFAVAYVHIFDIYFNRGLFDRGLARVNQFIDLYPDSYTGYLNRGFLHLGKGQIDKARQDFDNSLNMDPLNHRGIEPYMYLGDYRKAAEVAERIIKADLSDGNNLASNFRLARVKTIQGKRTKENQDKQRRAGELRKRKTGRTKGAGACSKENYGR